MKILSIETSCDDTCISILEAKGDVVNASFKVLANNSNSQIKIHIPYGGVYPILAKREHSKNLPILLEQALRDAGIFHERGLASPTGRARAKIQQNFMGAKSGRNPGIDAIAVTYGPGLEMCLWEGIIFAQKLAKKWNAPLIPVNHMEGHIFSVFGKNKGRFEIPSQKSGQTKIKFPVLSLLVSGGHTQLALIKKWMHCKIIGETLDDAVGEAFDKVARMLELPYPGGPQISKLAEKLREKEKQPSSRKNSQGLFSFSLPRPMLRSKNFDFSFSGLKTAVLYLIRKIGKLDKKTKSRIALEFENAAIECLVYKTKKAIEKYGAKTLIVAGGVANNKHLKNEMKKLAGGGKKRADSQVKLFFPAKELAGDNSLMIGIAGYLNYIKNKKKILKPDSIKAIGDLRL